MNPLSRSGALLCWLVLFCLGAVWIGRQEYVDQHERFFQSTSVAQRMLSQKTVQHEAVLATLAALSHPPSPERLYPSLRPAMPQLLGLGHLPDGAWSGSVAEPPGLPDAVERARQLGRPVTLPVDDARYWLVAPSGWSLLLDARQLVPPADFPPGLANLTLSVGANPLRLLDKQPGDAPAGWSLALQKPLGAASQPFQMRSERRLTPATWPWAAWLAWALASALLVAGAAAWQRSRAQARRQQEQLRLGAMARLGALGEMAAGIAHELNQPLTAILAQTRAAQRLLDDEDERPAVRHALLASAEQAKRAADIISRMRALVQSSPPPRREALDPDALVASLRFLREPDLARQGIRLGWHNASPGARPLGDRVALEQILHNLVQNAADALDGAAGPRQISIEGRAEGANYLFSVSDTGPGIAADALPRLFAPFYTTRPQGMGLGLALCDTLAGSMDGRMSARNLSPAGACFTVSLPLSGGAPAAAGVSHA
ncbi:sensor histidine kinase [Achromobacter denitrificans]|uniref:sensor histidine kinase n=1 Tax=Achromobacter denitrificans TaxID=32002 RepID=UPI000F4FEC10|nr:ATP-binding protein [Achromobacter denitrificans]MBV2162333.1 sensor histidine kinase [Achromobacter denitrificans]MDX3881906.1 ATP-binding protein [Achromobacter sp.]QCS66136.1 sensor histidine kinase [Achromobacter denitrificans]WFC65633.1 sensor histidine kinase [Achromobacter denitrificans]